MALPCHRLMALIMHQCTDILSAHHFLQVAVGIHIEYDDREVVLFTHRGSGQVHYLQAPGIDLIIRNIKEDPVSVVKNGLPVPPDMMTTLPCSSNSIARHLL